MNDTIIANCPCGGHTVTLPPDKPPVGGRAAFTCPTCGQRRTFVRTLGGVVFDAPEPQAPRHARPKPAPAEAAPVAPQAPAAQAPAPQPAAPPQPDVPPSLVPAGVRLAMAAVADPAWKDGLAGALPEAGWFVLAADDPARAVADFRAHGPRVILLGETPAGAALAAELAALPGRARAALTLLRVGEADEADPFAAFAASADAVLDGRCADGLAERIRAALDRTAGAPSLFADA